MLDFSDVREHLRRKEPITVERNSVDYFSLYGTGMMGDFGILGALNKEIRDQLVINII